MAPSAVSIWESRQPSGMVILSSIRGAAGLSSSAKASARLHLLVHPVEAGLQAARESVLCSAASSNARTLLTTPSVTSRWPTWVAVLATDCTWTKIAWPVPPPV